METETALPSTGGRIIVVHTDGACIGNPGPGGWAATIKVLEDGAEVARTVLLGGEPATTNNRMEQTAALRALEALPRDRTPITVFADSQLLTKGMAEWLPKWKANRWRGSGGPVKNVDLWQALDAASAGRPITWKWVRGHAGDPANEEVDALANAAALSATEANNARRSATSAS
jgi:ribonuclease HI